MYTLSIELCVVLLSYALFFTRMPIKASGIFGTVLEFYYSINGVGNFFLNKTPCYVNIFLGIWFAN